MKYILTLLLLASCSDNTQTQKPQTPYSGPKFKAGDCLAYVLQKNNSDNEFSNTPEDEEYVIYKKIIKVGQKNYQVSYGKGDRTVGELPIEFVDNHNSKVSCTEAGF